MKEFCFEVYGQPRTKGSTQSFPIKKKDGSLGVGTKNDNPKTQEWQHMISTIAQQERSGKGMLEGPVGVELIFYFARPKSAPKKRIMPEVKPDIDKTTRAVLDSLSGVLYQDDNKVCDLVVRKRYSADGPKAVIRVYSLSAESEVL